MTDEELLRQKILVSDSESWAERPVKISVIVPTVTGTSAQAVRLTDEEAFDLFTQLGHHLLAKRFLKSEPQEHPCGDYPAPCNHDPAHEL